MTLFVFEPGQSPFHAMDAVSKFAWLTLVTVIAVLIQNPADAAILLALILAIGLGLARLKPLRLARRLSYVAIVALWLLLVLSLTAPLPGAVLFRLGSFHATTGSVLYGLTLSLRVLTLGAASSILVLTTDPRRMVGEFIRFGHLPYRAGFAIYAALRFLPLLQNEARTIRHAQAVRADPNRADGFLGRFTTVKRLAIPLLAGALRRVHITAVAMDARGFGAHPTRTEIDDLRRPWTGLALVAVHGLILVFVVVLRITGQGGFHILRAPIGGF